MNHDDAVKKVIDSISKDLSDSKEIIKEWELLKKDKAKFTNAYNVASQVSKMLSKALKINITDDMLVDKKLEQELANMLIHDSFKHAYTYIRDYSIKLLEKLNKKAKITGGVVEPIFDKGRIDGITKKITQKEYEKVKWVLDEPVNIFCKSVVDYTIKRNVRHHAKLGLRPVVRRISSGKCCKWCDKVSGIYDYPDVPKDVYRRHKYCDCTVEYDPRDGKRQDVWTKQWISEDKKDKIEKRKEKAKIDNSSNERLKNLAYAKAYELKLNPIKADKVVDILRADSKKWIDKLTDEEKRSINKYTFNGNVKNELKLYDKLNKFLTFNYITDNSREKEMLLRHYYNIDNGILKNRLLHDIIVYRKDARPHKLEGVVDKFLSTSVTQKGVFGGKPNIAILVPKGAKGAYIEPLSDENYKKQREFLINKGAQLKKILQVDDVIIYLTERGD